MKLKTHYWDDPVSKSAFKEFMIEIFGLDFSRWDAAGFWDEAYTPFSLFEGGKVVSSACGYLLDAVIDGKPASMLQFSGVGTLPTHRRKGLSRKLTEGVLEWAQGRQEGIFLFSSDVAVPFYTDAGFTPVDEYVEVLAIEPVPTRKGLVRLDTSSSGVLNRIYKLAYSRAPISEKFSVLSPKLLMFHVLYGLGNDAYEIPELGCIIFFEREDSCVRIYDIVAATIPSFADLHPYISKDSDRTFEFHFHPDRLGLPKLSRQRVLGNNPFVLEGFPMRDPVFPFTSRA